MEINELKKLVTDRIGEHYTVLPDDDCMDYYPVVDCNGILTGGVVMSEESGYVVTDDGIAVQQAGRYKLKASVWQDGSGYQPHEIADRYANTKPEAIEIANKLVVIGDALGSVTVDIICPGGVTITVS